MTSDIFSFKAKEDGKVTKIKDDYMEVKYKSGKTDVVDLRNHVEKNSDGGFYINIKLDTELSVGKSFKAGDIIAEDADNTRELEAREMYDEGLMPLRTKAYLYLYFVYR